MPRRPGYSLLELIVVMAALVVLGGALAPTLSGITRDTRVKAGADAVRQRIADARAHAIGEARAYRLSVSTDGSKLRVAPDGQDFNAAPAAPGDDAQLVAEDAMPDTVLVRPVTEPGGQPGMSDGEWTRVATFLPDGTCREDDAEVEVREPNCYALRVHIRGLTGAATVSTAPSSQATR